ncbi:unnamed protein product [Arctia plantaginis]|uniref:CCHC-type domain-containing protein n=1 Tax=Arctia plantaginis TaxID=874455 RepID=A0A8S1B3R5_ARCPL|nr:unnamed protein product [Arctia plantaginis]
MSLPDKGNNPTSEDGTPRDEQRPNDVIQAMANTFKTTMNDMMAQLSYDHRTTLTEMISIMKSEENVEENVNVRNTHSHLITRTQAEYGLRDHEVRLKAASVLKGCEKTWADSSLLRTTTWTEMRDDMLQTFEPESRCFADILRYKNYTIDDAENIQDFISNVWRMFKRIVKPNPTEQDAVEFVIGSIGDERIRTELLNSKSNTVPELIAIAKTFRKRNNAPNKPNEFNKRPRLDFNRDRPNVTCYVCGQTGPFARHCSENAIHSASGSVASSSSKDLPTPLIKECFTTAKELVTLQILVLKELLTSNAVKK